MLSAEGRQYFSAAELSAQSGLSKQTIFRLKDQGKLPYFQPAGKNGRLLFPPDAIEQACRERQPTRTEQPRCDPVEKRLPGKKPNWMHNNPLDN